MIEHSQEEALQELRNLLGVDAFNRWAGKYLSRIGCTKVMSKYDIEHLGDGARDYTIRLVVMDIAKHLPPFLSVTEEKGPYDQTELRMSMWFLGKVKEP
jgi:hypothetical protein